MPAYQKIVQPVTERTELHGDAETGLITGYYGGYTVLLEPVGGTIRYILKVAVRGADGSRMDPGSEKPIAKGSPAVTTVTIRDYEWIVVIKHASAAKTPDMICQALDYIADVLRSNGQISVCAKCGEPKPTEGVIIGNGCAVLCEECFREEQEAGAKRQFDYEIKVENVPGGVAGALLGSLAGMTVMVLLGQLGYVAAVSGVVMGIFALKGYEFLGGKLTKKGIVISVAVMALMVWIGNRLDWAITLRREVFTEDSLLTVFRYLGEALSRLKEAGADVSGYIRNLLTQYLFSPVGAASAIVHTVRSTKNANRASRISSSDTE